jgi:hypothetical protein
MIETTQGKIHWNYFLALEKDLEVISRYIEFSEPNFQVFSIELARLLFAAASEVDVIAKSLCKFIAPDSPRKNIDNYKDILVEKFPNILTEKVFVSRYGLSYAPWDNWSRGTNPFWWRSYNNVKHQRDQYFHEATLKHSLNALGGLLIFTILFYSYQFSDDKINPLQLKETTRLLEPESCLLRLNENYYYSHLIV